jgi:uncharacterized protein (AIM24 family)
LERSEFSFEKENEIRKQHTECKIRWLPLGQSPQEQVYQASMGLTWRQMRCSIAASAGRRISATFVEFRMGASIQMTTHTQMAGGGGFFGAIRRVAGGGSLFMTEYRAYGAAGELAFAAKVPGHILPVPVGNGNEYLVHRHGFLCGTPQVQIGVGFQQSLGAGIFGGDGFRLQHIEGEGTAWIELSGEVVTKDLRAGETLRVHPGHVGAFQASVSFQIARIPGIRNMIFGGDGIFLAALTGPAESGYNPCRSPNWHTR